MEQDFKSNTVLNFPTSPITILLLMVLLMLLGMFLGSITTMILGKFYGLSLKETIDGLSELNTIEKRNFIRISTILNHLFLFVSPPVILAYIFMKRKWYKMLGLRNLDFKSWIYNLLYGGILLLVSMPFVQYLYNINKQLPLPTWATNIEDSTNQMIKSLLVIEQPWELMFNFLVVAVIPALGEEFVFRGILQKRLEHWFVNHHTAIWLSALIFSLFHLQLEGFLPRMFLGALLGYLFYWTKSLWIPIFVHFLNNAIMILAMFFISRGDYTYAKLENTEAVPLWGALLSFVLILFICFSIKKTNSQT